MGLFSKWKKKKPDLPTCRAVIVAAGSSSRMGADKLFLLLGGIPVIAHTLLAFQNTPCVGKIILVTRSESIPTMNDVCKEFGITKAAEIITGGAERTDSVLKGVMAAGKCDFVMVHDGARPLVSPALIEDVYQAAVLHGAAAPGVPVKDTVKILKSGFVAETPDRASLVAIQTPQTFYTDVLKGALTKAAEAGKTYSDDCQAVEALGVPVFVTKGSYRNLKITTEEDLMLAEALLEQEDPT